MKAGSEFRGFAQPQNDGRIVSSIAKSFDSATDTVTWTINVSSRTPLHYIGVKVNVGQGGHVQGATYNGQSMSQSQSQGSEATFTYRHGASRQLNGTVVVTAKCDKNVEYAVANLQVIVLLMVEQREIFLPFMMVRLRLEIVLEPMLQTQYPKAERL